MTHIAFIGLGIMGKPMAANLVAGGHTVYGFSRSGVAPELVEAGVVECASAREAAEKAEIVILMLPDTPDVGDVLFGAGAVAEALGPGKLLIDMSSISPIETKDYAAKVQAKGADYIDAPVSGGEVGAKAASLTIMVGASEEAFARAKPLFELMGKNITLVGEVGAGQITKVANQIIVALNIEAVSEALLLAARAGADPAKVRQALMGGFAASRVLEVHGERMIKRTFNPGFRINLHKKDLNLALATAEATGVDLPNTKATQGLFDEAIAMGGEGWDHSGMIQALEKRAGYSIPPQD